MAYGAGQKPKRSRTAGWTVSAMLPVSKTRELSRLHGKLIALGMLDFQLSDRTGGMRYQVTSEGQQSLKADASQGHAAEEADAA